MRSIIFGLLTLLTQGCQTQHSDLSYRSIDYYLDEVATLELNELVRQNVLIDSATISDKYRERATGTLNEAGLRKYSEIKSAVYKSYFKDYLYQQHIVYGNEVYALYFTVAGFDYIAWEVVRWPKSEWHNEDRLSRERLEANPLITLLFRNYDEGPKNTENCKIFIKDDYLVLERGNLYHSLYDLKSNQLVLNEESPWHAANETDKEQMNNWIRLHLHDPIKKKLNLK